MEGGGQADYCSTNWGNGFATNPTVIAQNGISDATPFFQAVLQKPWLSQVGGVLAGLACRPCGRDCSLPCQHGSHVSADACTLLEHAQVGMFRSTHICLMSLRLQVSLAPHFYCPGVSGETRSQCYQGTGQWQGFDNTVGYLTRAPGYCSGGKCKVGSEEHAASGKVLEPGAAARHLAVISSIPRCAYSCMQPHPHAAQLACSCLAALWGRVLRWLSPGSAGAGLQRHPGRVWQHAEQHPGGLVHGLHHLLCECGPRHWLPCSIHQLVLLVTLALPE